MRIGILSQWYDPETGPVAIVGVVARGLRDAGHEVVVLTGYPNYPSGTLADGYHQRPHLVEHLDGVEVHRVPLYPSHDRSPVGRGANYVSFALTAAIAALPVLGRVDAVWIYNSPVTIALPAAILRVFGRVPGVLHIQDLWPDSVEASGLLPAGRVGTLAAAAMAVCASVAYRLASTVAVISPSMRDLLIARGVPESKISWLPNCADEQLFRPVDYDAALAHEIGAVGRFTVMYGGSLGDVQALDTAVRAAALLKDRPTFRLLLVGSGVAEASLRRLAEEIGADNVDFLGRRPAGEMPALMRVCDAQLVSLDDQPFLAATMPSKVQVALASGRPVVVCAPGDAADLIEKAGAGATCAPGDPAALAATIRELVDAPTSTLQTMGEHGLAYYWNHLSAHRLVERLVDLCADAAGLPRETAARGGREPQAARGDREPQAARGDREPQAARGGREPQAARGGREPQAARGGREPQHSPAAFSASSTVERPLPAVHERAAR